MNYFVTAIDTDSGKTLISAIVTQMLGADYWKPIQSGEPRDTETVRQLVSHPSSLFHSEGYLLKTPASPHASAKIDGVEISLNELTLPKTSRDLVIEGAGGVLVPLNDKDVVIDLPKKFASEVILVSNFYLGSINHTLLTIQELKQRGLPLKGIIFNGDRNEESERIILEKSDCKKLLHVPREKEINTKVVEHYANELKLCWD